MRIIGSGPTMVNTSSSPLATSDETHPVAATATSAGVRYYSLFKTLRDQAMDGDNIIFSVQSLIFAAQYHCVDNTPHPTAQALLAEAIARCLDGGLHRLIRTP